MEVEQLEIREHLRRHPPFSFLGEGDLDRLSQNVEIAYFRAGSDILRLGQDVSDLHYIRQGSVEVFRSSGEFYNRLDEGEIFGQLSLISRRSARFPVRALEDTLIYFIPASEFRHFFDTVEPFADFVEIQDRTRLRQAGERSREGAAMMTTRVEQIVQRDPVMMSASGTVEEAARIMTEESVSSILVCADDGNRDYPTLLGILTDSDLRRRLIAKGLPYNTPVSQVMSESLISVESDDFLFAAMMAMLRHNVHHLPVMQRMRPVGVIDLSDLAGHETRNSLFITRSIHDQSDIEGLKQLLPDIRGSFLRMNDESATTRMIGSAIAMIGRSFKQRLLELAEERLGPPPIPYCFLALGSMARDEQSLVTDQDNALILDDEFDPKSHEDYFRQLAEFVCDGLAELGYPYCKGNIMATNKELRQPLSVWKDRFTGWIAKPDRKALLNSSIFFDLDGVHGETGFADVLKAQVAEQASNSPAFLGCLAHNAQTRTPPLGFFRDFVLETSGRHQDVLDLKRRGTAPMVDVIRVHAMASASLAQNSFRRLDDIESAGFLTSSMTADLRDALEFIAGTQYRHHAQRLEHAEVPDNKLNPATLNTFDRRNLKDAFRVLSNAQRFLRLRYRAAQV
jgi:CBS domain-containing protein